MELVRRQNRDRALNPISQIQDEINHLFDDGFFGTDWNWGAGSGSFVPSVDVEETENEVRVTCELPGVSRDDLDIEVSGNQLSIKGEKKREENRNEGGFSRRERWHGTFERRLLLPEYVDRESVSANMKDGVLVISIPKREEVKPKKIAVKG